MKDKLKDFMFYSLLFFSIGVVCLFIVNMLTIKTKVELSDSETNLERWETLRDRVALLPENSCSLVLNNMIDMYKETSFDGEVSIKELSDMYYKGTSFIQFYLSIKEECGMSDDVMRGLGLPNDSMNSITYMENFILSHMFSYEFNIKDNLMRGVAEISISNIEYRTCKSSELDMIEKTLNYIGGVSNE